MSGAPDTTWLTPSEVQELTGRQQWKAQSRKLAAMGVKFRPNGVGRPLVERASILTQPSTRKAAAARDIGPDWAAMNPLTRQ